MNTVLLSLRGEKSINLRLRFINVCDLTSRTARRERSQGPAGSRSEVLGGGNALLARKARVFAAAAWMRQQKHLFSARKRSDRVHKGNA